MRGAPTHKAAVRVAAQGVWQAQCMRWINKRQQNKPTAQAGLIASIQIQNTPIVEQVVNKHENAASPSLLCP